MGKIKQPSKNPPPPPASPAPVGPAAMRHYFSRADWITAAITFLIAGGVFFYYMSPSVTMQDSGELVTGAFNFGVPHPPGYPLWAFLGWVWRHLVPFGNPAWRICLMSVFTGALVVGVLTLLMTRSVLMILRSSPWAEEMEEPLKQWVALTVGAAVALLFAFNRGVWLWACVPEMRVLNVFMFILTACTFFAWMMQPERHRFLYATILAYALAIANHQTAVVMALPFFVGALVVGLERLWEDRPAAWNLRTVMPVLSGLWELTVAALLGLVVGATVAAWLQANELGPMSSQSVSMFILFGPKIPAPLLILGPLVAALGLLIGFGGRGWLNRRRALICAAAFLIGCSFYLYMPIASATNPPMNWGYTASKQGFLHHITRGQYERLNIASPLSREFFIQISLFTKALVQQYTTGLCVVGLATLVALVAFWKGLKPRGRAWLIFVWVAFLTTSLGLLTIINPGLDKQNQEINIKFFAPAHGFFAMLIGYGLALAIAYLVARWRQVPRLALRVVCLALLALPIIPFQRNWAICEQRGHDFGYQFGYRMFYPGGGYPPMDRNAVLYGGTDPGRFVPTYMIFCESRVAEKHRFRDSHLDPKGGAKFDRRDVYIITQNALADSTYMSYVRDHYDHSRPDPKNPATLERFPAWRRTLFKLGWKYLWRDGMYPVDPIYVPTEQDTQRAFQEYVEGFKNRQPGPDEQVEINNGQVQVKGVGGVMAINAILTKWIFDRAKEKHSFYVEESYVIPWMYPYLSPAGIIMKINRDELPGPEQNPELWAQIVAMDRAYWDQLCAEFAARPEFARDTDAQKTFSKLRSAIGGVYSYRRLISEAEYAYQQARALCPDSPEANFRLAQLYLEQNRVDDALAVLNELQQRDPLNAKIAQSIQQIGTMRQGRVEVQQFETAFTANPRDVQILIQLAQAYLKAGQPDKVGPLCDGFLAQPGISAGDMIQITQVYLSLRQIDRALATLQLLISRFPQESQAYYGIAIIRTAQGVGLEALDALARAIELNPALRDQARNDARFNNLRGHPRFQQITGASANPFNLN